MKKTRIAINGFGRIGRLVLRAYVESGRDDLEFVAINDLAPAEHSAHLLEFDSVHGRMKTPIELSGDIMTVGGQKIKIMSERNPGALPWKDLDIDIVMECTGIFSSAADAKVHIDAGAKKVLVSSPSEGADSTIVFGVNNDALLPGHTIVSCGSCTTNALAPVAKILDENFGIENGWMTTVHAYTGDQNLLDKDHKDMRRARAAAMSMVPSSTGAAKAIGLVLPNLAGKLNGAAIRVPVANVSMVELVVNLSKPVTADDVNALMKKSVNTVLGYNELPLVSVDFIGDAHSSVFDATMTHMVGDKTLHITTWYDNEWGFACRMSDVAALMN